MSKLTTLVLLFTLTGCNFYYAPASELEKVLSQCSENGGVKLVQMDRGKTPIFHSVHCNDGAIFNYSSFKRNKK